VFNQSIQQDGSSGCSPLSKQQVQQILAILNQKGSNNSQANVALSKVTSRCWIIDSGATDHISSSQSSLLHRDKNCSLPPVLLPSGEKANIIAKGSLPLNSVYYLHDVLCVPTFKVDLMSVSRLTRGMNCSVTFFSLIGVFCRIWLQGGLLVWVSSVMGYIT
jgi:hypothetical protein